MEDEERLDIEIYIQTFIINIFGAIDNLAWIVNAECKLELPYVHISLYNSKIQKYFSDDFKEYLNGSKNKSGNKFKDWYDTYCKAFRHALAHRIPLYVPPCGVSDTARYSDIAAERWKAILAKDFNKVDELNEEEKSSEHIIPLYTHSFEENSPHVIIHSQLLADFRTIIELSDHFLGEF